MARDEATGATRISGNRRTRISGIALLPDFLRALPRVAGVFWAVAERFVFVFAEDELGASPTLCGLSVAVTVVFEVPIFAFGEQLLRASHDRTTAARPVSHLRTAGMSLQAPSATT